MQPKTCPNHLVSLADFIVGKKEEIIKRWIEIVSKTADLKSAHCQAPGQLIDHLPKIFEDLCHIFRSNPGEEIKAIIVHTSRTHGYSRWKQGYDLFEVL